MWGRDTGDVGTEETGTQGCRIWDIMGTGDVGHGDREKWGRGGGHRDTAADLPALTPDPQHHGCRGGDTDGAAGAEGDTATSGVGTAAVPPSDTRPLLGAPCFTFSSRGGAVPHWGAAMPLTPPLQVSPQGWWPRRWQCPLEEERGPMEGGGLLSPKAGGRGGATVASVSPPLHVPPPQPPILGHFRPRPAKCHPKVGGER